MLSKITIIFFNRNIKILLGYARLKGKLLTLSLGTTQFIIFLVQDFLIFLSAYNNLALRLKLEIINPIVSTLLPSLQDYWLAGFTDAVRP